LQFPWHPDIYVPPEQVLDTVDLYFLKHRQRKLSLKFLSWFVLHETIQTDTHDSIEDAKSALNLYKAYQKFEEDGVFDQKLEELYKEGKQYVSARSREHIFVFLIYFFWQNFKVPSLPGTGVSPEQQLIEQVTSSNTPPIPSGTFSSEAIQEVAYKLAQMGYDVSSVVSAAQAASANVNAGVVGDTSTPHTRSQPQSPRTYHRSYDLSRIREKTRSRANHNHSSSGGGSGSGGSGGGHGHGGHSGSVGGVQMDRNVNRTQ
jgi:hypothetical protein